MIIENIEQPEFVVISNVLRLRKLDKSEYSLALPWYKNNKIMYFVNGYDDRVYDIQDICRMYDYQADAGELYFIEVLENGCWMPIGDVTLAINNLAIVIGDEGYWGKGVGKLVLERLLIRARSIGIKKISGVEIYHHNERSKRLFLSLGFVEIDRNENETIYELELEK